MNKESFFCVGYISKKIGFRGKISIKINIGNPKDYLDIDFIYIDIENQLIPFKVTSCLHKKNIFLELKIEDINDEKSIAKLLNKNIFLNKKYLKKENVEHLTIDKFINYSVFNQNEKIGFVVKIIKQKSQNLIIVESNQKKEILIPLVADFIKEIDEKNKTLSLDLPKGLIDLNF